MDENEVFWPNYLFFADFSDDQASLVDLPVGPLDQHGATILAAALSTHDSGEGRALWVDQENPAWGLLGANIKYNGVNQTSFSSNGAFDHVLMLEFPDTQTSPKGIVALNYNVGLGSSPSNPELPEEPTDAPSTDTPST